MSEYAVMFVKTTDNKKPAFENGVPDDVHVGKALKTSRRAAVGATYAITKDSCRNILGINSNSTISNEATLSRDVLLLSVSVCAHEARPIYCGCA